MAETPPSANAMDFPIFLDTNVGTNLVMVINHNDTVRDLKRKIMIEHALSFPVIGEIEVSAIKMKHEERFYHLSELMLVEKAFYGCEGSRCLHVDANLDRAAKDSENGIPGNSLIGHDRQQERITVLTNDPSFHPTTTPSVKDDKIVDACLMQNDESEKKLGELNDVGDGFGNAIELAKRTVGGEKEMSESAVLRQNIEGQKCMFSLQQGQKDVIEHKKSDNAPVQTSEQYKEITTKKHKKRRKELQNDDQAGHLSDDKKKRKKVKDKLPVENCATKQKDAEATSDICEPDSGERLVEETSNDKREMCAFDVHSTVSMKQNEDGMSPPNLKKSKSKKLLKPLPESTERFTSQDNSTLHHKHDGSEENLQNAQVNETEDSVLCDANSKHSHNKEKSAKSVVDHTFPLDTEITFTDANEIIKEVCNQASGRMAEDPNQKLDDMVVPKEVSKQMNEKVLEGSSGFKGENVDATVYPDHPVVTKSKCLVHKKKKTKKHDSDDKVGCILEKQMVEQESEIPCRKSKAAETTTDTTQNVTCEDPLVDVEFPCDGNIGTLQPTEKNSDKTGSCDLEAVNHEDIISSQHDTNIISEKAADQKEELHTQKNRDAVQGVVISGNHPETITTVQSVKDEVLRRSKRKSKRTDPSIQNSINNITIHTKERGQEEPSPVTHSTIVADTSDGKTRRKKKKIRKTDADECNGISTSGNEVADSRLVNMEDTEKGPATELDGSVLHADAETINNQAGSENMTPSSATDKYTDPVTSSGKLLEKDDSHLEKSTSEEAFLRDKGEDPEAADQIRNPKLDGNKVNFMDYFLPEAVRDRQAVTEEEHKDKKSENDEVPKEKSMQVKGKEQSNIPLKDSPSLKGKKQSAISSEAVTREVNAKKVQKEKAKSNKSKGKRNTRVQDKPIHSESIPDSQNQKSNTEKSHILNESGGCNAEEAEKRANIKEVENGKLLNVEGKTNKSRKSEAKNLAVDVKEKMPLASVSKPKGDSLTNKVAAQVKTPRKETKDSLVASADSTEDSGSCRSEGYRIVVRQAPSKKLELSQKSVKERKFSLSSDMIFDGINGACSRGDPDLDEGRGSLKSTSDASSTSLDSDGESQNHVLRRSAGDSKSAAHMLNSEKNKEISGTNNLGSQSNGGKMKLGMILRNSSTYKKAKLSASQQQSEDEDSQQVDVVMETQPEN